MDTRGKEKAAEKSVGASEHTPKVLDANQVQTAGNHPSGWFGRLIHEWMVASIVLILSLHLFSNIF